jgi:hypothetical protein
MRLAGVDSRIGKKHLTNLAPAGPDCSCTGPSTLATSRGSRPNCYRWAKTDGLIRKRHRDSDAQKKSNAMKK